MIRPADHVINELSVTEERVVISKDLDIYYSHVLHDRPWKLLLVRTGNMRASELQDLFQRQLPAIVEAWAHEGKNRRPASLM